MLEILIVLAMILVMAAKKGARRRRRGNFRVVRVQFNISLSTLTAGTMLSSAIGIGTGQEYYAISGDITWVLEGLTPGEAAIAVGIAHGDYSVTELDEWYEATGVLAGDMLEKEEGKRLARDVGIFAGAAAHETLNDGRPIRTKIKMRIQETKTLNVWVRNMGTDALTTGASVRGFGKVYLNLV